MNYLFDNVKTTQTKNNNKKKLTYVQALNLIKQFIIDKDADDIDNDALDMIQINTLITLFYKHDYARKIINEYLNSYENINKFTKKEILLFLKEIFHYYCIDPSILFPLYKKYKTKIKMDKKLNFIKPYEYKIIENEINTLYNDDYKSARKNKNNTKKMSLNTVINNFKNIKSSTLCKKCTLRNGGLVLFDSNNKSDISNCDILFVGEAPGKDEVEQNKPFVGRSGKLLRRMIEKYFSNKKWFISNTCLCRPDNNRTPTSDELNNCAPNLDKIIEITNPKYIVSLGKTAITRLNANPNNSGILSLRGKISNYKHQNGKSYKVFPTVHPSYIIRGNKESIYDEDFTKLLNLLNDKENDNSKDNIETEDNNSSILAITLDEKYYTDYYLIDIVYDYNKKLIYYIFRNRKTYKRELLSLEDNKTFYYYLSETPNDRHVTKINKTIKPMIGYPPKNIDNSKYTLYEADIPNVLKHSIDYYYNLEMRKLDNSFKPLIMYLDIEVATKNREFPSPEEAKYPISIISFRYGDIKKSFVFSKTSGNINEKILNGYEVEFFSSERTMIEKFKEHIRKVDIITAWNVSFDMGYIINRFQNKLKRSFKDASPLNMYPKIDLKRNIIEVPGIIIIDLLSSYKQLTYGERESYKLDYIANYELGERKLEKGSDFGLIFKKDKKRALLYNIDDVEKILKLDQKLSIISFESELRNSTAVTWNYISHVSKIVESNMIKFLKSKNMILRNNYGHKSSNIPKIGAYVKTPINGLHYGIYIVDFKSLYPSIIQTFNIGIDTYVAKFENLWHDVKDYLNNVEKQYVLFIDPSIENKKVKMNLSEIKDFLNDKILTPYGTIFYKHEVNPSINYDILTYLADKRNYHKKKMKNAKNQHEKQEENNKQRTFKEISNSNYGYYGFEGSRLFDVDITNTITTTGQYLIKVSARYSNLLKTKNIDEIKIIDVTNEIFDKWWINFNTNKIKNDKYEYKIKDIDLDDTVYTDTDSIYKKIIDNIKKPKYEDVMKLGDKIFKDINEILYPSIISKLFNFESDKNHLLLEYEDYAERAYWPAKKKKRYAYITRDKNISIKGLEIQRSDYPSITRERLKKLVEIILTEDDVKIIPKLEKEIKETDIMMQNMIDNFDTTICKPVSFSTNEYKKVPSHVIGMNLWNILNEREDFRPGTKGYQFLVTVNLDSFDNNTKTEIKQMLNNLGFKGQISNIVVPEDYSQDQIKRFFDKFSTSRRNDIDPTPPIKVNKKEMMNFIWYQRVLNLLESISDFSYIFSLYDIKQNKINEIYDSKFADMFNF